MRYRKRFQIFSCLHLNISKTGLSITVGKHGISLNIGKSGVFLTTSIPGTGVYDRRKIELDTNKYKLEDFFNGSQKKR